MEMSQRIHICYQISLEMLIFLRKWQKTSFWSKIFVKLKKKKKKNILS